MQTCPVIDVVCCPVACCAVLCPSGELYDLMDMFDAEEAQQRLYKMKPDELFMHLALQGE